MPPKGKEKKSKSRSSSKTKEKKERQELEDKIKNCEEKCIEAKGFLYPTGKNAAPNFIKAKASLEAGLEFYSSNPQVFFLFGEIYRMQDRFPEAVQEYSKALDLNPTSTEVLESRGSCYQKMSELPLAMEDFTSILEIDPDNDHAYNMRGLCVSMSRVPGLLLKSDDFSSCESDFKNAIRLNPANYYAMANLAKAYEDQGRPEDALEYYNASLAVKKDYQYAIFRRGCVEYQMGEALLRQESETDEDDADFAPLKVTQVQTDDKPNVKPVTFDEVENGIKKQIHNEERVAKGKSMLGLAIKDFESLILTESRRLQTDVMAALNLGICHLLLDDLGKAEEAFKLADEVIAANPGLVEAGEADRIENQDVVQKVLQMQKEDLKRKKLIRAQAQM